MPARRGGEVEPERLVADLYEAACEPSLWSTALDGISDALGGAALVGGLHRSSGLAFAVAHRIDPDRQSLLLNHYVRPDTNPLFGAMPRLPVLKPIPRQRIMSNESYARSGLFNDIYRPQGLTHVSVACLARENDVMITCGLLRRRGRPFTKEHAELYEMLMPHLRRTFELTVRNLDLTVSQRLSELAASSAADGLILVDWSGCVLFANERGARVLDASDGLAVRGGRVVAIRAAERSRLATLIEEATLRKGLRGGSLRVSRTTPGGAWGLVVTPTPNNTDIGDGRAAALLRIIDLDHRSQPPAQRLADFFGLSRAEARLAAELAAGEAPESIAERHGVKISTIRTQLRAIFAKTGTTRQPELVALIARLADPPPPEGDQAATGGAISR